MNRSQTGMNYFGQEFIRAGIPTIFILITLLNAQTTLPTTRNIFNERPIIYLPSLWCALRRNRRLVVNANTLSIKSFLRFYLLFYAIANSFAFLFGINIINEIIPINEKMAPKIKTEE